MRGVEGGRGQREDGGMGQRRRGKSRHDRSSLKKGKLANDSKKESFLINNSG